jgi:hypothetical protein
MRVVRKEKIVEKKEEKQFGVAKWKITSENEERMQMNELSFGAGLQLGG